MAVWRNPYSTDAREDDVPYSREALLAALDEPEAPPVSTRPRVPTPMPVRSGAVRRGAPAPEPEPAPVPEGWSQSIGSGSGRSGFEARDPADTGWQQGAGSSSEPPDYTGFEKSPEKPDYTERVTSGFDPATGARKSITPRPRTPGTSHPLEYYTDPANARLTAEAEETATDPYTLPEPTPAPPSDAPLADGAVLRPTFRPGAAAVGQGQSFFENLVSHDTSPESYLPGYDPRSAARKYDGGTQAPQPDQLSPQMQSTIRGAYGLDVNGLSEEDVAGLVELGWVYGDVAPSGFEYSDDGLLKKSGSVLKTIGRIAAIAAPVVATIATGGAASPWLTAAIGAGAGAASSALRGGDWRSVLTGAALGGGTAGFGAAGAGVLPQAALGAAGGALTGGGATGALLGAGLGAGAGSLGAPGGAPTTGQALTNAAIDAGLWGVESAMDGEDGAIDPQTGAAVTAPATTPPRGPASTGDPSAPPRHGTTPPAEEPPPPEEELPEEEAAPQVPAGPLGEFARNLEGFDMRRFEDPSGQGNNTVKYQVGRVLSKYAPTADGLAAAAEELRAAGFDVEQGGRLGDLLVFGPGVTTDEGEVIGTIDVGRGFGAGGSGWAWQPTGGADAGGGEGGDGSGVSGASGATSIQDAYAWLKANADPTWSRAEMEAAVTAAFGEVPGFEKAYAGDVVINGRKIDLITDFEGGNPSWSDNLSFVPLHPGGGGGTGGGTTGLTGGGAGLAGYASLAPGVSLSPALQGNDVHRRIQAEIARIIAGASSRDELLAALGVE